MSTLWCAAPFLSSAQSYVAGTCLADLVALDLRASRLTMFVYALLQDAGITWVEFVQANTDCCLAASSEEDDDKDDDAGSSQNNVI